MNVIAVNGSPRKGWNTATLLKSALDGAESAGVETKLVHLYDLDFKGCVSCFSCKRIGGESYGHCALKDDLLPVLREIEQCDALILGSPVYFGDITGEMRSFLERLLFQYLVYDKAHSSLFKRKIKTGFIYTMNVPEEFLGRTGYAERFGGMEGTVKRIFGSAEPPVYCTDTMQFDDYSKVASDMFDAGAKAERRKAVFPEDCRKAFELGARLAGR